MRDSGGGFWRVLAKLSQKRDQIIASIRDEYLRRDENDRRSTPFSPVGTRRDTALKRMIMLLPHNRDPFES
jgi:hypothetical protein